MSGETKVGKGLKSNMSRSPNSPVIRRVPPPKSSDNIWILSRREVQEIHSRYTLVAQLHQLLYNFNQNLILILNSSFLESTIFSTSAAKQLPHQQQSTVEKLSLILILDLFIITRLVKFSYSSLSLFSYSFLSSLCQDSRQNCVTI